MTIKSRASEALGEVSRGQEVVEFACFTPTPRACGSAADTPRENQSSRTLAAGGDVVRSAY